MNLPLKQLRKARKITQSELSKALEISPSTVGMWEQGHRSPDYEMLKRIAKYFNVSTDYLLDNEVDRSERYSEEETQLLADYRYLDKEGKNLVRSMMKYLRGVIPPSGSRRIQKNGSNFGIVGGNFNSKVTVR